MLLILDCFLWGCVVAPLCPQMSFQAWTSVYPGRHPGGTGLQPAQGTGQASLNHSALTGPQWLCSVTGISSDAPRPNTSAVENSAITVLPCLAK